MTEKKVWELLAELVTSQKKIDTKLAKTDAKLAETSAKIDRVSERVGGISNNQVKIGEEFFDNSLQKEPVLASKRFDFIDKKLLRSHQKIREE